MKIERKTIIYKESKLWKFNMLKDWLNNSITQIIEIMEILDDEDKESFLIIYRARKDYIEIKEEKGPISFRYSHQKEKNNG